MKKNILISGFALMLFVASCEKTDCCPCPTTGVIEPCSDSSHYSEQYGKKKREKHTNSSWDATKTSLDSPIKKDFCGSEVSSSVFFAI